jgi:hypothetical protein
MLTRHEADALQRQIDAYTEAWEAYVKAVANSDPSRFGAGALVASLGEDLRRLVRQLS